ncbi:WXG100 family type VII secretion target [Streptomyces sp. ISL-98]|uniref:WXG100 family type VII secretion target n=1 Tax=unclassified Streptomyces TaxID=2593676 RepID=UPI001BEB8E69|nr:MULTISPECIES: WXG100 family type VII secretion target [unclassified Streptomyces]MBT2506949.1 WXG100 family type VII secretion target [Streptomyces sp. ISL-98]MBT2526851.1 WXG100 family type VII secretion target [Streptomyces sp. ISL-99]
MAVQKVNGVSLGKLQGELSTNFDSVKGQLQRLQATIDSLEGQWQGIGAGAFNVKQTQINNNMVRIGKLLLKFQEAIAAARTISGTTEDEVEAALKGIDVAEGYAGDSGAERASSNLSKY